jgi:hypothetical protein
MPDIDCIEDALASTGWNKARIRLLACLLAALLSVQSVCLTRLATVLPSSAKTTSVYRRLQRFLAQFTFDEATLSNLLIQIARVPPPWILSLDRTEWKLGRVHLNLLVLSVVVEKTAFPLLWSVLQAQNQGKAGASNTAERCALLARFVALFGSDAIVYLCADREFVGKAWVGWLLEQGIAFRLRVKADTLIQDGKGEWVCADWLFRRLAVQREYVFPTHRRVFGQSVFVGGKRLCRGSDDDLLIVISNEPFPIADYADRWPIETLFGTLKSRGFDLEATHVTCPERLSCLFGVLAIAYCWAFVAGWWLHTEQPHKPKKHGRLPVSIVRRGLDWLRPVANLFCATVIKNDWKTAVRFLSCT